MTMSYTMTPCPRNKNFGQIPTALVLEPTDLETLKRPVIPKVRFLRAQL